MDKTTTWLVRGAALVVIGGGLFAFLGSGNKTPIKIKSSVPTVEDWKWQELEIKRQSAEDAAKREFMNYRKIGNRLFCNASMLSYIESVEYKKQQDIYILGKDADLSQWNKLIDDFENERSKCRDFNP